MNLTRFTHHTKGPLGTWDCRVKTVVLLAAVVVVSTLTHWQLLLVAMATGVLLLACIPSVRRDMLRRLCMPFGIAWLVLLNVMFTHGSTALWHYSLAGYLFTIYREGVVLGIVLFLRIMTAVLFVSVLAFSTMMIDILQTLRLCRIPAIMVDIAEMMYRYVFILQDTSHTLRQAQLSRLSENQRWYNRVVDAGRIAGAILLKSFDRSQRIYLSMLARGYDEENPDLAYFTSKISIRDIRAGFIAGFLLFLLIAVNTTI